jgi:glucose-1-phosphate adenylyltransferase
VPPAKFIHDEDGRRGSAVSSLVSGDCIVSGSRCATRSVHRLPDAFLSSLEYVVALPQVVVNRKAQLKNCVIDRGVVIPEGLVVGEDPEEDAKWFRRTEAGIVLSRRTCWTRGQRKMLDFAAGRGRPRTPGRQE